MLRPGFERPKAVGRVSQPRYSRRFDGRIFRPFTSRGAVVAAPPHHLTFNVADILRKIQERIAQGRTQGQLPRATIIDAPMKASKPHDPRPPRLTVVADPAEDNESHPR